MSKDWKATSVQQPWRQARVLHAGVGPAQRLLVEVSAPRFHPCSQHGLWGPEMAD